MTKNDKTTLLWFIFLTPMYIQIADENGITAFVNGYEAGTNHECDFTQLLCKHLEENLSTISSSDGWWGQTRRYAKKANKSWTTAFKQVGLNIIALEENGGLDSEMQEFIKSKILTLIENIGKSDNINPNKIWLDDYKSFCSIKSNWFKKMWTDKEYKTITTINKKIAKTGL